MSRPRALRRLGLTVVGLAAVIACDSGGWTSDEIRLDVQQLRFEIANESGRPMVLWFESDTQMRQQLVNPYSTASAEYTVEAFAGLPMGGEPRRLWSLVLAPAAHGPAGELIGVSSSPMLTLASGYERQPESAWLQIRVTSGGAQWRVIEP